MIIGIRKAFLRYIVFMLLFFFQLMHKFYNIITQNSITQKKIIPPKTLCKRLGNGILGTEHLK